MSHYQPLDREFETKSIHVGFKNDEYPSNPVIPPITLSTSYHQNDFTSHHQRFVYSRFGNPNRDFLEKTIAALENGKYANCFSSGMGAVGMTAHLLRPNDHVLCIEDVYGGTYKFFNEMGTTSHDLKITYADVNDLNILERNIQENTKMVWLETLTNPKMEIIDIPAIVKKVKEKNPEIIVVVDNSFLTPYFARPLDLGADISVSSLTKYMNGHSDVLMGATVTNNEKLYKILLSVQKSIGATPSPFDCYLVLRGLRTLAYRMRGHMCNGYRVAKFLESHPKVERVLYAGLDTHPGHEIAQRLWSGCSGMLSFYIKGNIEHTKKFISQLHNISCSLSYGGYESVIEVPMWMSKSAVPKAELEKLGITPNMLRLSVGLESIDTLIDDLKRGLDSI